jgi:hypothetical protein
MGIAKTPTWQAILESHDRRPREPHLLLPSVNAHGQSFAAASCDNAYRERATNSTRLNN